MSILERIPKYTLNNYNQLRVKAPEVYIDDIFDPLFNKKAKEYLDAKYGWGPIGNTFAGYAEGINNALVGQNDKWGILGPGMGILSGFGRSMDKADDFLIGGLTEGVNLVSQGLGNNVVAENPLENIFVNDEDYTGTRLLAAMGNTMSKMAGAPTLEESDFKGLWNVPAMGLELATDPGILGESLAKNFSPDAGKALKEMPSIDIIRNLGKGPQSPLADVGQLLSNYDDLMTIPAWDLTVPGLRPLIKNTYAKLAELTAQQSFSKLHNVSLNLKDNVPLDYHPNVKNVEDYSPLYFKMAQDMTNSHKSTIQADSELLELESKIKANYQKYTEANRKFREMPMDDAQNMNTYLDAEIDNLRKKNLENLQARKQKMIETNKSIKEAEAFQTFSGTTPDYDEILNLYLDANEDASITDPDIYEKALEWFTHKSGEYADSPSIAALYSDSEGYDLSLPYVANPIPLPGKSPFSISHTNTYKEYATDTVNEIYLRTSRFLNNLDTKYAKDYKSLDDIIQDIVSSLNSVKDALKSKKSYTEIPGLNALVKNVTSEKLKTSYKPTNKKYLQSAENLVRLTNELSKTPIAEHPLISDLIAFGDEISETLDTLKGIERVVEVKNVDIPTPPQPLLQFDYSGLADELGEDIPKLLQDSPEEFYTKNVKNIPQSSKTLFEEYLNSDYDSISIEDMFEEMYLKFEESFTDPKLNINYNDFKNYVMYKEFNDFKNVLQQRHDTEIRDILNKNMHNAKLNAILDNGTQLGIEEYLPQPKTAVIETVTKTPINIYGTMNAAMMHNWRRFFRPDGTLNFSLFNDFYTRLPKEAQMTVSEMTSLNPSQLTRYVKNTQGLTTNAAMFSDGKKFNEVVRLVKEDLLKGENPYTNKSLNRLISRTPKKNKGVETFTPYTSYDTPYEKLVSYLTGNFTAYEAWMHKNPNKTFNEYLKTNPDLQKRWANLDVDDPYNKGSIVGNDLIRFTNVSSSFRMRDKDANPLAIITEESLKQTKPIKSIFDAKNEVTVSTYNWEKRLEQTNNAQVLDEMRPINYETRMITNFDNALKQDLGYGYGDLLMSNIKNPSEYTLDNYRKTIQMHGDSRTLELFDIVQGAKTVNIVNNTDELANKATLHTVLGQRVLNNAKNLNPTLITKTAEGMVDDSKAIQYYTLRDKVSGDIVAKENLMENLILSRGHNLTILDTSDIKTLNGIEHALNHNLKILDPSQKTLRVVKEYINANGNVSKVPTSKIVIGITLNTSNKNIVKDFKNLDFKNKNLKNIIWEEASKESVEELAKYTQVNQLFDEVQEVTAQYHKLLGYAQPLNESYVKHTLSSNVKGAEFLTTLYSDLNINTELLDEITNSLSTEFNLTGALNTKFANRSLRGNFSRFNDVAPIFATDLTEIVSSSLAKGAFENTSFQEFVDLFINDNFKISRYASNVDDLLRILRPEGVDAKLNGNLSNLVLISPKYNEFGTLTGFTKYSNLSRNSLQKALNNKDTILVPINSVAHLDDLCKKRVKLTNPIYQFFNKTFTVPYKLGVLANPGFLLGNASDATLKQITALAQKHGTTLSEEMANLGMSIRNVCILNNQMQDLYEKYLKDMSSIGHDLPEGWLNYSILTKSPKAKTSFIDWVNQSSLVTNLTDAERAKVHLWFQLNNFQDSATYDAVAKKSILDLENVKDIDRTGISRITLGAKNYDPKKISTWGIFDNNPYVKGILKSSAQLETVFRSACVLNDLTHKYTIDEISNILETTPSVEKTFRDTLKGRTDEILKQRSELDIKRQRMDVDFLDALNVTESANFNYENTSGLMDSLSYIIPFPTFFMKNLAFWLDISIRNPQYLDNAISVQQGLWSAENTSSDEFTAEAKGRGAIPVEVGGQKLSKFFRGIYKQTPLASMFGAFNLLNQPLANLENRIHPLLQLATSPIGSSKDVYYRPYNTNIYQRNIHKNDKDFNALAYAGHKLNPLDREVKTFMRTPNKVFKGESQLSDFLPSVFQPKF